MRYSFKNINSFFNQRNATENTNHPRRPWTLVIGAAYYVGDKSGLNEATGEYISTLKKINEENKNDPLWHIH